MHFVGILFGWIVIGYMHYEANAVVPDGALIAMSHQATGDVPILPTIIHHTVSELFHHEALQIPQNNDNSLYFFNHQAHVESVKTLYHNLAIRVVGEASQLQQALLDLLAREHYLRLDHFAESMRHKMFPLLIFILTNSA